VKTVNEMGELSLAGCILCMGVCLRRTRVSLVVMVAMVSWKNSSHRLAYAYLTAIFLCCRLQN
jgi:hypothetical protein